jgi:hypothetical protein
LVFGSVKSGRLYTTHFVLAVNTEVTAYAANFSIKGLKSYNFLKSS